MREAIGIIGVIIGVIAIAIAVFIFRITMNSAEELEGKTQNLVVQSNAQTQDVIRQEVRNFLEVDKSVAPSIVSRAQAAPANRTIIENVRIDFETFPGVDGILGTIDDIATSNWNVVRDQYACLGATFALADGSAPIIRHSSSRLPSSPFSLLAMNSQGTDPDLHAQDVIINFSHAVSRVKISAVDADEFWVLRAFNAQGKQIDSDSHSPGGDTSVIAGVVSTNGSQGFITKVIIDLTDGVRDPLPGPEYWDLLEYSLAEPIDVSPCVY